MILGSISGQKPGETVDKTEEPHRYWQFLFIAYGSNVGLISRLEMRETAGGPDLAAAQTPTVVGTGWTTFSNMFDGDDSTFGYTADATRAVPCGATVDFGATEANWKVIREVAVRNRSSGSSGEIAQAPLSMLVRWSDDGVRWKVAWQFVTAEWTVAATVKVFTKPVAIADRTVRVLDIAAPPTDSGPHAITLTANGNATTSGGRFVFDGNGDYYSYTGSQPDWRTLPYLATIEIDALASTDTSTLDGVINIGDGSTRIMLAVDNGQLQLWVNSTNLLNPAVILPGAQINVKLRLNGAAASLYVNGKLVGTATLATPSYVPAGLYLGALPESVSDRSLNGGFAGVRITHGLV